MDDYGEEGEMEFMELAPGESQSATHSSDEEEEAVQEILASEKKMKAIKKEAKALGRKDPEADDLTKPKEKIKKSDTEKERKLKQFKEDQIKKLMELDEDQL